MNIDFEKSEDIPYHISAEQLNEIQKRIEDYEKTPEIGISYEEVKRKIKKKYTFTLEFSQTPYIV